MVTSVSATKMTTTQAGPRGRLGFADKVKAYIALTKPRVIELLLVTTLPTMIFAARSMPGLGLILATLIGGAFAAGSAGAFNCYIDRDIDKVMHRTSNRPLVTGAVTPREALVFAWLLGAAAIVILWFGANPLSGLLGVAAIFLYVVVYSLILKRRTSQNIVWGGAAGCMPVLIAWAAVTNKVEWPAVILFMVIFLWTPPHYWPLSMRYSDDYNAAKVPMLGAVAGSRIVSVQVVLYTWAMVVCSLLMIPLGSAGIVYTVVAGLAGVWFLLQAHQLHSKAQQDTLTNKGAMKVFHGSISYLTLLFVALAIDPFVGMPLVG
ncbi:MAG: protoheme farnesyltransferase [Micrococcaceae bacterium]|nr:protoheme farnesyltransferase [Micrococcaceae bacterium]